MTAKQIRAIRSPKVCSTGQMCLRVWIKDELTPYMDSWSLESSTGYLQKQPDQYVWAL